MPNRKPGIGHNGGPQEDKHLPYWELTLFKKGKHVIDVLTETKGLKMDPVPFRVLVTLMNKMRDDTSGRMSDGTPAIWISNSNLAQIVCCSTRAITNATKWLAAHGFLRKELNSKGCLYAPPTKLPDCIPTDSKGRGDWRRRRDDSDDSAGDEPQFTHEAQFTPDSDGGEPQFMGGGTPVHGWDEPQFMGGVKPSSPNRELLIENYVQRTTNRESFPDNVSSEDWEEGSVAEVSRSMSGLSDLSGNLEGNVCHPEIENWPPELISYQQAGLTLEEAREAYAIDRGDF
jgi:hypothetical protein